MVKVTFVPSAGVGSSTPLVTTRSACGTSTVADALFGPDGSFVLEETVAVLVIALALFTVAVMSSVAVAPLASAPIVQTPVALE